MMRNAALLLVFLIAAPGSAVAYRGDPCAVARRHAPGPAKEYAVCACRALQEIHACGPSCEDDFEDALRDRCGLPVD
jgi:hypothetical protein